MILTAGLSPAWQQILTFDALTPGDVNRAARSDWCASGKVLNVARAVQSLGAEVHVVSTIGGPFWVGRLARQPGQHPAGSTDA